MTRIKYQTKNKKGGKLLKIQLRRPWAIGSTVWLKIQQN